MSDPIARSIRPASLRRLESRVLSLAKKSDRLATLRLASVLAAIVLFTPGALGHFRGLTYSAGSGALLLFIALLFTHRKVENTLKLFGSRLKTARRQKATADLDWTGIPPLKHESPPENLPPYFFDLDIVGKHSLLQLLNYTVSTAGYERLVELFRNDPVPDEEIERRSELTIELRALKVLRHGFVSRLDQFPGTIEKERLESLLNDTLAASGSRKALLLLFVLQSLLILTLAYAFFAGGSPYFLIPILLLILGHRFSRRYLKTGEAYEAGISMMLFLEKFSAAAALLEKHSRTERPRLRSALEPFRGDGSASSSLRRLNWIAGALGVRQNFIAHALVHVLFPWDPYWTFRLHVLKEKLRERLPQWETSLAEFEAFLSLANHWEANTALLPANLLKKTAPGPFLSSQGMKHPLIPSSRAVGNDLELREDERCALITGSNMSGKSTFLRATGVNYLLAKAGAPVAARRFEFRNAPLYSSLRVSDSLDEGLSSFYAETKRLADVLRQAREHPPVFFLIDEIFRGTNNRERLIGSRAFIREITRIGNFGLVTTHDLELCSLEQPGTGIANYHFREAFEKGVMSFSYQKLRGPSPTTNALEVMRLSGLPVE